MKFCPNCGHRLDGESRFCPNCGNEIQPHLAAYSANPEATPIAHNNGLVLAAKIFFLLAIAFQAVVFVDSFFHTDSPTYVVEIISSALPFAWQIPMLVHYWKTVNKGEDVGTPFKVCTLIFASLVSGILMLVDKPKR
ncbi:MAG: zinc ribbon domain-containing protein [Candidatus Enteromonas sp.]|nr:zinc ribbon domain-containing protein [Candidatus Enteromonas sp.]